MNLGLKREFTLSGHRPQRREPGEALLHVQGPQEDPWKDGFEASLASKMNTCFLT